MHLLKFIYFQGALLLETIETVLDVLITLTDEVIPGVNASDLSSTEDIPSPISMSFSNTVFIYPQLNSPSEEGQSPKKVLPETESELFELNESIINEYKTPHTSFAIDLIIRYEKQSIVQL